jgi:glycosyltransferase involved in cell wall biosynthesis
MKFSIVTCSYQQGRFLDATIRSVLDQGVRDLEYILIDGGSRDTTLDVIRRHESRLSYWVSEKDRGQTHALNKGFARATGDVMGWLCSDDLLLPGALKRVEAFFQANPDVDFVYGNALWIDEAGHYLRAKKEMPWSAFVMTYDHNYLAQPACFWRRSLHEKVEGLDESWNLGMDADLWMRFSHHTKPVYFNEYLACMRYYPEQKTRSLAEDAKIEGVQLRDREMPFFSSWPYRPLHLAARVVRVCSKLIHGGYGAKPSKMVVASLDKYIIP